MLEPLRVDPIDVHLAGNRLSVAAHTAATAFANHEKELAEAESGWVEASREALRELTSALSAKHAAYCTLVGGAGLSSGTDGRCRGCQRGGSTWARTLMAASPRQLPAHSPYRSKRRTQRHLRRGVSRQVRGLPDGCTGTSFVGQACAFHGEPSGCV